MTKFERVKRVLIDGNNMRLFKEYDGNFFAGGITLEKSREDVFVFLDLPEDSFYNVINIVVTTIPADSFDSALYIANQYNDNMRNGYFYVREGKNRMDDIRIDYHNVYTAFAEDFNEYFYNDLLIGTLNELDNSNALKEFMKLKWS